MAPAPQLQNPGLTNLRGNASAGHVTGGSRSSTALVCVAGLLVGASWQPGRFMGTVACISGYIIIYKYTCAAADDDDHDHDHDDHDDHDEEI